MFKVVKIKLQKEKCIIMLQKCRIKIFEFETRIKHVTCSGQVYLYKCIHGAKQLYLLFIGLCRKDDNC